MSRTTFVVASHNQHKLKEFARILEPLDIEIVTPSQCGGEGIEPVEDGDTFEKNSVIKATQFAKALNMPALADDSGICVDALNGAPGVYSARYSGAYPDGSYFTVRGECEGRIGFEYRGENGFGYDPLFYFENGKTFAEISGEEKDALSHRGKALRLLAERLSGQK